MSIMVLCNHTKSVGVVVDEAVPFLCILLLFFLWLVRDMAIPIGRLLM